MLKNIITVTATNNRVLEINMNKFTKRAVK
jgi:hypothetical protein